jgi:hypothetical protein
VRVGSQRKLLEGTQVMALLSADTIHQQLAFLAELDQLKSIVRQSPLINRTRKENSAEHSWHLAMFALVLSEHAEGVDVLHVVKLLLVHDIVEIDAGDAPIHVAGKDRALLEKQNGRPLSEFSACSRLGRVRSYWLFGSNSRPPRHPLRASQKRWIGCSPSF